VSAVEQAVSDAIQRLGLRRMVTLSEGEAALGISHSTMKNFIRDGKVRSVKIGGSRRIPIEELNRIQKEGV
jgi:excisionase family DNA binding protein